MRRPWILDGSRPQPPVASLLATVRLDIGKLTPLLCRLVFFASFHMPLRLAINLAVLRANSDAEHGGWGRR